MAKILIVGVLDNPNSTNYAIAKAFTRLGHNIVPFNYRTVLKENDYNIIEMNSILLKEALKTHNNSDLVFFCKTDTVDPSVVSCISEKMKTWYWFMDPIKTAREFKCFDLAKAATFASATSSNVHQEFLKVNKNSFLIPEGFDPDIMFKAEYSKKLRDVIFIGNADQYRIDFLSQMHTEVTIFGQGWPARMRALLPVYGKHFRETVSNSKIVLNITRDHTIVSNRLVDSAACGTLVLSTYAKDVEDVFSTRFPTVNNPDQMDRLCERFLSNSYDLKDLAYTQHKYIRENFSWDTILGKVLRSANVC